MRSPRVLAAVTGGLALAVCGALFLGYYAHRIRRLSTLDLVLEGDFPIVPDAEIGFVPAARAATVRAHPRSGLRYSIFTSGRRARVDARGEETPGAVDILAVGCSFTWGHGVENEQTYVSLASRRLGASAANLAFASYGTVQSLHMLERNLDLRPRLVLYGVIQDHGKRNLLPCAPTFGPSCLPASHVAFDGGGEPYIHAPDLGEYEFNRRFWDAFFFGRASWPGLLRLALEGDARRVLRGAGGEGTPDRRRRAYDLLLARMRAATEARAAHLLVVHLPYLERGTTNGMAPSLRQALLGAASPSLTVLDLSPLVSRHYADPAAPLLRFELDSHPSAAGHAFFADAVAARVREGRWLEDRP